MAEEEGEEKKPETTMTVSGISTRVQPELYERFREIKKKYGLANLQEAQRKFIDDLETIERREQGEPEPTQRQLDAQQGSLKTAQQMAQMTAAVVPGVPGYAPGYPGGYIDPMAQYIAMQQQVAVAEMWKGFHPGRREEESRGGGFSMREMAEMDMRETAQSNRNMDRVILMKMIGTEAKEDSGLKPILEQMERDRRDQMQRHDDLMKLLSDAKGEEERRATMDLGREQSERLMTYMNAMGENYQNFTVQAIDRLAPRTEGAKTDMTIVREVLSEFAEMGKAMRESGGLFGLAPISVEKVVSEQERSSADKIENYLKAIGGIVHEVKPLIEGALAAGREGPPSPAAMAPTAPPPPGVTPETDFVAPGLTRAEFERQMEGKLSGGQWFIYDENEYANMVATTGQAVEGLPQVSRISTTVGVYIVLSEDQLRFLNGLAEQYQQSVAAQQVLAQQPAAAGQPGPGTREWVAPPVKGEAKPPEEPIEEVAEPAPLGTAPAPPSVIPRDKDWSTVGTDGTLGTGAPVMPVVGLETDKPPEAPQPELCKACQETKVLSNPPYCGDCWKIIDAVMTHEAAQEKAKIEETPEEPAAEVVEPEEAVAEEPEEAAIELPPNAEQIVEGPDGKPAVVLNPLACQYCGKNCKSRGGRAAHERSCLENPENKEAETE